MDKHDWPKHVEAITPKSNRENMLIINDILDNIAEPPSDAEWFQAYDTMMLTEYDRILKLHTNVNGLVWKNFNPFQVDFNTESFIIVTCPWVRLTSQMHGNVFDLPVINEAGWWAEHYSTYGNVEGKQEYMMKQLDNLEASNKLLKTSSLNGFHPNETFHAIWALYILGKTEWVTL